MRTWIALCDAAGGDEGCFAGCAAGGAGTDGALAGFGAVSACGGFPGAATFAFALLTLAFGFATVPFVTAAPRAFPGS
jgi:hypothetical protein